MTGLPTIALCVMSPGKTPGFHRAAQSARGVYDELCWLDTSSRVPFDFGAARNRNIAMASSDWLLIVDDDEVLTVGWDGLKGELAKTEHAAFAVQMTDHLEGGTIRRDYAQHRLFRRGHVGYEGTVHHQFHIDGSTGALACHMDHYGYDLTPEESAAKYAPRVPLYEARRGGATPPEEPMWQYQYAQGLYLAGRYLEAFEAFRWGLWYAEPYQAPLAHGYLLRCLLCMMGSWPCTEEQGLHLTRVSAHLAQTEPLVRLHAGMILHACGFEDEGYGHMTWALLLSKGTTPCTYRVDHDMIAQEIDRVTAGRVAA